PTSCASLSAKLSRWASISGRRPPAPPTIGGLPEDSSSRKPPGNDAGDVRVVLRECDYDCMGWIHSLISWLGTSGASEQWSAGA
ncbi:MAG: hypothetical protein ACREX3_16305, partial [Gammaproteobacteria bacterium]